MVLSDIDIQIHYTETPFVDKKDVDYESYVYRGTIFDKKIKIALGRPNFEYVKHNIVYFNIYLANLDLIVCKIGVYETKNSIYNNLLDDKGFIILEKLGDPLIFAFAKNYIIKKYILEDINDIENIPLKPKNDIEDDISDFDTDYSDSDSDNEENEEDKVYINQKQIDTSTYTLKPQTKEDAIFEMQTYKESPDDNWFNKFMKSSKYNIVENEGGGDCLFAVIRDALKSLNIPKYNDITVKKLRNDLANSLDEPQFNTYMDYYRFYKKVGNELDESIANLKKKHNTLKNAAKVTDDPQKKSKIIEDAKKNLQKLSSENNLSKEIQFLNQEFNFMKDVKTIDDLRNVIKSSLYWADVWAISTLEKIYNIKLIIFAKDFFEKGEKDNVLQCGEADKELIEKKYFEPDYYILTDYQTGIHYRLITYDKNINKSTFKFLELPYRIKELILTKCMEKMSGPFSLISDFKKFALKHNIKVQENTPNEVEQLINQSKQSSIPTNQKLYDDSIIIQIFNRAGDKPIANGKKDESISGEFFSKNALGKIDTTKLYKIKDWRKKLDNSWIMTGNDTLNIRGKNWASVSHYLYATRFINLTELFDKFSIDSQHDASKSLDDAKKLYDKLIKSYKTKIITDDEYNQKETDFIMEALQSKFTYNPEFKEILLLTSNAKINIFKPGKGASEFTELMKLRKLLS